MSIVLGASTPVDAFFVPPAPSAVGGASTNLFPPKTKILPNPNSCIQHLSDHMPCHLKSDRTDLYGTPMHSDNSPDDASRREIVDIALGAMTGWILGPRVSFAASLSDRSTNTEDDDDDDDDDALSHPWDEKYKLLVEYYRMNGFKHGAIDRSIELAQPN